MRDWLTRPAGVRRKAEELYGMVVAAARNPGFYGVGRVADTPEGRFEQVALHLFLIAERVAPVKPEGEALARHLIEALSRHG
jgi:cytochrome b pre-mRNA-processing protein 3